MIGDRSIGWMGLLFIFYFLSGHCCSCGRKCVNLWYFYFYFFGLCSTGCVLAMWVTEDHSIKFVVAIGYTVVFNGQLVLGCELITARARKKGKERTLLCYDMKIRM